VHQSVCYDYTISLLRRKMRDPRRLSMGTLYWQLNDVWQVGGAGEAPLVWGLGFRAQGAGRFHVRALLAAACAP
jgi:hypothetical protein